MSDQEALKMQKLIEIKQKSHIEKKTQLMTTTTNKACICKYAT